jgi:hypothetical protein
MGKRSKQRRWRLERTSEELLASLRAALSRKAPSVAVTDAVSTSPARGQVLGEGWQAVGRTLDRVPFVGGAVLGHG